MPRYSANITQLHSVLIDYDAPDDETALYLANFWSDTGEPVEERIYAIARMDKRWPDEDAKFHASTNFLVEAPRVDSVAEVQPGDDLGDRDRVIYRAGEPRQSETAAGLEQEARELRDLGASSPRKGENS